MLEAGGTAVVGGLGLWLAGADRDRVVCVTGTKGKSTTTAGRWPPARAAGAPGDGRRQPRPAALRPRRPDRRRLLGGRGVELPGRRRGRLAPVVAVTSLHPDHLPWHRGDPDTYFADKLSLCTQPGA